MAPLVQAYFYGDKPEKMLRRILIETVSATVATLPILLVSFGQISTVAPIANMLVLPLVPIAMLLTLVAGIAGLILPSGIASILGWAAQIILTYMTTIARFMGGLIWALQGFHLSLLGAAMMYGVIILFCLYMSWVTKYNLRNSSLVE
ncbi:ComEC/Rec2 family competence protein [Candidatus Saccharibacteria bacterium]|nr:ComEC/Rec2 family competence protein [Candidatus Saccharibacteria bacterium]